MPLYVFNGPYPAFYPDVRAADGRSLSAEPGDAVELAQAPDANWIPAGEAIPPAEAGAAIAADLPAPVPDLPDNPADDLFRH